MTQQRPKQSAPFDHVQVHAGSASYSVEIGSELLPSVLPRLDSLLAGSISAGKAKIFVVTSSNLLALWGDALLPDPSLVTAVLEVPAGEQHKRMHTVERLSEELASHGADRDSLLLALGGGVIGDLTGFLAAIYMRGIRWVGLPTTLLAQVDSSIGGKTGANLGAGKNLVGAFHHPLAVFADVDTLRSLPFAELRAGLQEAIKSALIRDAALFDFLEQRQDDILAGDPTALAHVVSACVRIKAAVVAADEREGSLRMILNLGHTLGHAIEAATKYTELLHGEAVAWGMLAALQLAESEGSMTAAQASRSAALIRAYGPLRRFDADPKHLVALTAKDKKNRGGARSFVLPVGIGDARVVHNVGPDQLLTVAQSICQMAKELPA